MPLPNLPPKYRDADFSSKLTVFGACYRDFAEEWLKKPTKLVLWGNPGRGKTWYMYCLIAEIFKLCPQIWLILVKAKDFDDEILRAISEYSTGISIIKEKYGQAKVLFLDDFGVERSSERTERDCCSLLDYRLEWELPTVISTNLSQEQVKAHYGERIESRLKEYHWVEFNGDDLRRIRK